MSRVLEIGTPLKYVKITAPPMKLIAEIVKEACSMVGLDAETYALRCNGKPVDSSMAVRMANIPVGARLELYKQVTSSSAIVTIALQVGSERVVGTFHPLTSVWAILKHFEKEKDLKLTEVVSDTGMYMQPTVDINRNNVNDIEDLVRTTLKSLGLTSGSVLARFALRPTDIPFEDCRELIDGANDAILQQQSTPSTSTPTPPPASVKNDVVPMEVAPTTAPVTETKPQTELHTADPMVTETTAAAPKEEKPFYAIPEHLQSKLPEPRQRFEPSSNPDTDMDIVRPVTEPPRRQPPPPSRLLSQGQQQQPPTRQQQQQQSRPQPSQQSAGEFDPYKATVMKAGDADPLDWEQTFRRAQEAARKVAGESPDEVRFVPSSVDLDLDIETRQTELQKLRALQRKKHEQEQGSPVHALPSQSQSADTSMPVAAPDRRMIVIRKPEGIQNPADFDVPDNFYQFTQRDLIRVRQGITRKENDEAVLKTREIREREAAERMTTFNVASIRVMFPNKLILQCEFRPTERESALVNFVREQLETPDRAFYLYTTPPVVKLSNPSQTLAQRKLVPAAVVYFAWADKSTTWITSLSFTCLVALTKTYLKPELEESAIDFTVVDNGPVVVEPTPVVDGLTPAPAPHHTTRDDEDADTPSTTTGTAASKPTPKWFKK